MPESLLQTKLYIPPLRPNLVARPHLIERLDQGLQPGRKLTLISAPAGFGKTTLVSEWLAANERPTAWLSLDEEDNDPSRFLVYLVAALQTLALSKVEGTTASIGEGVLGMLQSPQPPPTELILTELLNEITTIPDNFILVLDDYHLIDAESVNAPASINGALIFLLEHQPPQMHLVIATREDPDLTLARLRARGQLIELRATDLRFTSAEAAEFLNQVMGLDLSEEDIAALETRTEGWIAGLQLAALALQGPISMQRQEDITKLIESFTGSHRFVLDYLIEEVLEQQSQSIQTFLLQTAILDRLTGSLCDALTGQGDGQQTLEMLDRTNLFIVPLDSERRWYRYHHLFADLLRRRLHQNTIPSMGDKGRGVAEYHIRASEWFEENGLETEAFLHAAAANDIDRAERLIEGDGLPLSFRGIVAPVLKWLESLPTAVLNARPSLWVAYAMAVLTTGHTPGVEEKLQAAEAAIEGAELDDRTRDLIGRIADSRGTMAVNDLQVENILAQSNRALEYLHPDNLTYRTSAIWKLGIAYEAQGDRIAAGRAYSEAKSISQASGNVYTHILATIGLASIQMAENQLHLAAETYGQVLEMVGDSPIPVACHVHLCLAWIFYEWNDLDEAQRHSQQGFQLGQPYKEQNDIVVACEVFVARLKLAQGDIAGATETLVKAEQSVRQHNFVNQIPEIAAARVLISLLQGDLIAATTLAQENEIPTSQARVHLAAGDTSATLAILQPLRQQVEEKGWKDEWLKVAVLEVVAHQAHSEEDRALQLLGDVLALAEPEGFVRTFVDEGPPMAHLLQEALRRGVAPDYVRRLLLAFSADEPVEVDTKTFQADQSGLIEPLSEREVEVLQLIAEGLTNRQIADRLYLSINTVKVHAHNSYGKLGVKNRTQAVARARQLGVLPRS